VFERQFQALKRAITQNERAYQSLLEHVPELGAFPTADTFIRRFLSSRDAVWKSNILNDLIPAVKHPDLRPFLFLLITAVFSRKLSALATSCPGRQISPEDLYAQANLILLEEVHKAARKHRQEKLYINLTLNLKRDFYLWVKANDFQFNEIQQSQEEWDHPVIDTDKLIRRIIESKVLSKSEIEFYLDLKRDGRKIAAIARDRGIKPNTLRKKLQRIEKKMSRFSALKERDEKRKGKSREISIEST